MVDTTSEPFWSSIRQQATPAACRRFGYTLLIGWPAAGVVWLMVGWFGSGRWIVSLPITIALAGLLLGGAFVRWPALARRPHVMWHATMRAVEWTLNFVLLFVAFFGVITPVGLCRRRWPVFARRPQSGRKTYWQDVARMEDLRRYYRQF